MDSPIQQQQHGNSSAHNTAGNTPFRPPTEERESREGSELCWCVLVCVGMGTVPVVSVEHKAEMASEHRAVGVDLDGSLEVILCQLKPLLAIIDRPYTATATDTAIGMEVRSEERGSEGSETSHTSLITPTQGMRREEVTYQDHTKRCSDGHHGKWLL
jgi:hypothetical protein